jgi:ribosomal protein S6--L-glutamate ligase
VAAEAARVLRLEVCAVDMLDVKGRPLVFEVNSSPSIREAEAACGVDLAARIVDRAVALAEAGGARAPRRRAPAAPVARPQ